MRLQLFVTLALASSALAQRSPNPIRTSGNTARSGIAGRPRTVGPGEITLPNLSGFPSDFLSGRGLINGRRRNINPIRTNGNMLRSGVGLTGFGPDAIALPNLGVFPPDFDPGLINGRRLYASYGAAYDPIYDADASFDGFYSELPPNPYQAQPGVPTPAVVINEGFQTEPIHPQLRDYSNVKLPEPGTVLVPPSTATASPTQPALQPALALDNDQPIIFLIAFQDHTILPAIAYWVQGDTLHYIRLTGAPNQVNLALIDRDFSKQLNRDRHVPFALPTAK